MSDPAPIQGSVLSSTKRAFHPVLMELESPIIFLGDKLGGIREGSECDTKGFPVPELVFQSTDWNHGIVELLVLAGCGKTAVMCSERDFKKCHRHFLIEKTLSRGEWKMKHIDVRTSVLSDSSPKLNLHY